MQMYRVKWARKLPNDLVDMGDAIVCASSLGSAGESVLRLLGLNSNNTELEVTRVKPSFYQISRREVKNGLVTIGAGIVDADNASVATFPGVTESRPDEHWHQVQAEASVRAVDETQAIMKLGKAIQRDMLGEKQKPSIKDLDIRCDRKEFHPRSPAVEQNALFSFRQIFQGGSARGK